MSTDYETSTAAYPPGDVGNASLRPEELPPVEPPSAGYIVQLFLIPALIVAAVIGVWALFGKLAESETNWRQLVAELGSSNEHRRDRAALGLAQILRNQQIAPGEDGVALADKPEVATALAELLTASLASNSTLESDIMHQEFLARTLGSLSSDEIVLPVLADALTPGRDSDVRKSSLMSMAMIAGRRFQEKTRDAELLEPDRSFDVANDALTLKQPLDQATIEDEQALQQLKIAAQDEEPGIRHLAAFVLGMISGPDAIAQLKVMLLDGDSMTRANAAVGLARNGQIDGIPSLTELIKEGCREISRAEFQRLPAEEQQEMLKQREFEQPIILSNSLRAIDSIWTIVPQDQRSALLPLITQLSESFQAADIRMQARTVLERIKELPSPGN